MANLFIFGIGGTGARVIRAFNMLIAANGGNMGDTRVFPIIIDYDVTNGDKLRALDSLYKYSALHSDIYSGVTFDGTRTKNGFFSTDVMEMKEALKTQGGESTFNLQYNPPSSAKKYSDSIGYSALSGELQTTQFLIDTLYNTSQNQEVAELHIDTTVGFRGNPNIGSVMLNNLSETKEFKEFSRLCTQNDRVVIIGSLFGGTGSSGIPVLVNAIRTSQRTGVNSAKISTILVCPYFKIGSPKEDERSQGVIDDKIFESKTKAALYYYQDALNDKIDAIYYIGDKNKDTVQHHVGKEQQKNPAHIVELVSAMAITHFNSLPAKSFEEEDATGNLKNHWKYGFNQNQHIDDVQDLDFSMFAEESKNEIYHLIAFALAGKVVEDYMIKNNKDCSSANFYKLSGLDKKMAEKSDSQKVFQQTLDKFIAYYHSFAEWMNELEEGSIHKLINFDFNASEFCDTLKTHPFRKEEKLWRKSKMVPSLKPSDLFSEMSSKYKTLHMPEGKDKEIIPTDTLSYAFFHSLYLASINVVNEKLNLK
ncbi:MAG: hypothetical protein K2J82_06285 [Muribaculaceae bacterium]|nr:hypothetical protein [Muribaculaceae bacterium]